MNRHKLGVKLVILLIGILVLVPGCSERIFHSVSGQVADEDGTGIPEVDIIYEGQLSGQTTTDSTGNYRIERLLGTTIISAHRTGWEFSDPQEVSQALDDVNFTGRKITYSLSISVEGEGKVQEEVLDTAILDYEYGTEIRLTAIPEEGWRFRHWKGDYQGTDNPISIIMDGSKEITAVFTQYNMLSGTISVEHKFPHPSQNQQLAVEALPEIYSDNAVRILQDGQHEDRLIVGFDEPMSQESIQTAVEKLGYTLLDVIPNLRVALVSVPEGSVEQSLAQVMGLSGVRYAEPDSMVSVLALQHPNDPMYNQQWHYPQIRLPQAWGTITGSNSVRVAVVVLV